MKAIREMSKAALVVGVAFLLNSCGEEGNGSFRIEGSNTTPSTSMTSLSIADEITGLADDGVSIFAGTEEPESLSVRVYEIMVSPNADCTNATRVSLNLSATHHDVMATTKPTLAAGDASGAFKCVILSVDDTINFTSSVTSGPCTRSTNATKDICTSGSKNFPDASFYSQGAGATEGTCSSANEVIPMYFTTASTNTSGFGTTSSVPPAEGATSTSNGMNITNTVVSGPAGKVSTLVFDGSAKVDVSGGTCTMDTPTISLN